MSELTSCVSRKYDSTGKNCLSSNFNESLSILYCTMPGIVVMS